MLIFITSPSQATLLSFQIFIEAIIDLSLMINDWSAVNYKRSFENQCDNTPNAIGNLTFIFSQLVLYLEILFQILELVPEKLIWKFYHEFVYKFIVCKYGLISSVNLKDFKKSEVSFPYSELPVDTTIWKNKVTQDKILILRSYEKTFVLQKNKKFMMKNSKAYEGRYVTSEQWKVQNIFY